MTRNSLDDLNIMNHILISYIHFLKKRIQQEENSVRTDYSHINQNYLSTQSQLYLSKQMNLQLSTMEDYFNLLLLIEKKISDFYVQNYEPLSLYSISVYKNTIQAHAEQLKKFIKELGKY